MTDRNAFHTTILEAPRDDTTRLVLADLLRESNEPNSQALGRFLWAGVTASQFRDHDVIEDPLYYTAQSELAAVTSAGHPARWLSELGMGTQPLKREQWLWDNTHDRVSVRLGDSVGTFTRGMLSELTISLVGWCITDNAALLAIWPLECVRIADVPGLTLTIQPPEEPRTVWQLEAHLRVPRRNVPLSGPRVVPNAVSPQPFLVEDTADWKASETFPDRASLVNGIGIESASLIKDLAEAAGDRWPSPPRRK